MRIEIGVDRAAAMLGTATGYALMFGLVFPCRIAAIWCQALGKHVSRGLRREGFIA